MAFTILEKTRTVTGPAIRHKEMDLCGYVETIEGDEANIVLDTGLNYGSSMTVKLNEIEFRAIEGQWP